MKNIEETLKKAREARQAKAEQTGGYKQRNPTEKSLENPKSYKLAIAAKCWDCSHGQKVEVTHCQVVSCPLHSFRPWQERKNDLEID